MKKFRTIFIVTLLIILLSLTLVACVQKDADGLVILKTPKLEISGNTVSWGAIKNAQEYGVSVYSEGESDVTEIVTKSTTYTISTEQQSVNVKVRAIGDKKKYGYSEYSNTITYTKKSMLETPKNVEITVLEDKSFKITWGEVSGATSYDVYLYKDVPEAARVEEKYTTSLLNYTVPRDVVETPAVYGVQIVALSSDSSKVPSSKSETVTKYVEAKLSAPENAVLSSTSDSLSWKAVGYAKSYNVRLIEIDVDGNVVTQGMVFNTSTNNTSLSLNNFTNENIKTAGKFKVEIQAVRPASEIYRESDWVEFKYQNPTEEQKDKPVTVVKYDAPTGFKLEGNILTWSQVPNLPSNVKYKIEYLTGEKKIFSYGVTGEEYDIIKSCVDMTRVENAGKLFTVSIMVEADGSVLEGVRATLDTLYQYILEPQKDTDGYYKVENLAHLAYLSVVRDANFILMNDLDCKDGEFIMNGNNTPFTGKFNGNNKTLRNLNIVDSNSLFGEIGAGGIVKDFGLVNTVLNYDGSAALIATKNNGTISNLVISGSVTSQAALIDTKTLMTAGVALENNGIIEYISSDVDVIGCGTVGGIVAKNNATGKIFDTKVYSDEMKSIVIKVESDSTIIGGIAGINNGEIDNSYVKGVNILASLSSPSGKVYAGGIVGKNTKNITNCYVEGAYNIRAIYSGMSKDGRVAYAGGIIGYSDSGIIKNSYIIKSGVEGHDEAGGVVGHAQNTRFENVYCAVISITFTENLRGSFIANNVQGNTFVNCYFGSFDQIDNAITKTTIDGVSGKTRDEFRSLDLGEMFILNTTFNGEFKIIKTLMYSDKAFDLGSAIVDGERTFDTVYVNDIKVTDPIVKANITAQGVSFDIYEKDIDYYGTTRTVKWHRIINVKSN